MTDALPVIETDDLDTGSTAVRPTVAGILLAAGTSSRYGSANKLIETVTDTPVVRRATDTLVDAATDPVIVVTGHESPRIRDALSNLRVQFTHNPDFESGQATSVRAGIDALPDSVDAVVIALGDMPYVEPETVDRLIEAYTADAGTALAAGYQGERGNPVLFDRAHFDTLRTLTGDTGGRDILLDPSTDAAILETGDPGVRRDVDVPDELE